MVTEFQFVKQQRSKLQWQGTQMLTIECTGARTNFRHTLHPGAKTVSYYCVYIPPVDWCNFDNLSLRSTTRSFRSSSTVGTSSMMLSTRRFYLVPQPRSQIGNKVTEKSMFISKSFTFKVDSVNS